MAKKTLPTHFDVMRDDRLIARIENCRPSNEMFWLTGQLVRGAGFAEIEALITQATNALDDDQMDVFDALYDQIHQMGVRLVDPENEERFEYFIIHIVDDVTVELRYAN